MCFMSPSSSSCSRSHPFQSSGFGFSSISNRLATANLRSCEYSNFDELCMHKIHYKTMILYLNYKNNVYKVENLNEKSGR